MQGLAAGDVAVVDALRTAGGAAAGSPLLSSVASIGQCPSKIALASRARRDADAAYDARVFADVDRLRVLLLGAQNVRIGAPRRAQLAPALGAEPKDCSFAAHRV